MKKDNKQRLFEVMERLDPSFSSVQNDNDEIEKMFSPEELKKLEVADLDDLKTFNITMDSESPHYDPFGYYRHDMLEYELETMLKNRGQEFDDKIIKDLANNIHDYFL